MKPVAGVANRLVRRLKNAAIDAASYGIAVICDNYPRLDERRQIHMLRLRLFSYEMRLSELEQERDNYKAAYEMQHGPTVELQLAAFERNNRSN